MANWIGHARSNYFRVKDLAAFKACAASIGIEVFEATGDQLGLVAIWPDDSSDHGGWPTYRPEAEGSEDTEIDYQLEVSKHLVPGEVAIFMEVGAEKLRYLTGFAAAINSAGERVSVDLNDIYEVAKKLGPNLITQARY